MESEGRKRQLSEETSDNSENVKRVRETIKGVHPIPEEFLPLLIGENELGISRLREQSKCLIDIPDKESVPGFRLIEITGFPEDIEVAREMIRVVVSEGNLKMSQKISEDVLIPAHLCGVVIGKNGTNVRKLEKETNCIVFNKKERRDEDKVLKITGTPENVEKAKARLTAMLSAVSVEQEHFKPENITFTIPIPQNLCGALIGKNGDQISRLQASTNCEMSVIQDPGLPCSATKPLRIYGAPDDVREAQRQVEEILAKFQVIQTPEYPELVPQTFQLKNSQVVTDTINIPPDYCGVIIGKNGDSMKKLRTWTNCHIRLLQDTSENTGKEKTLKIVGKPEDVQKAKEIVQSILEENHSMDEESAAKFLPGNSTAARTFYVRVPRSCVGAIIGLKGANITKIAEDTNTKIQFLPDTDPTMMERQMVIMGTEAKFRIAVKIITSIVQTNITPKDAATTLFYMDIPAAKCGRVIGKGGETIKSISATSGAFCELSKESPSPVEKTIVIRGSESQVEHAKHLIRIKVGDIPPNTQYTSYSNPSFSTASVPFVNPSYPSPSTVHVPFVNYFTPAASVPLPTPSHLSSPAALPPFNYFNPPTVTRPTVDYLSPTVPLPTVDFLYPSQESFTPTEHSKPPTPPIVDYSSQWLEYYMQMGDMDGVEEVKAQMRSKARGI